MRSWWGLTRSRSCWSLLLGLGMGLWHNVSATAQNITLDGSIGPAQTLTGPDYLIRQQDGLAVGNNLFHSFGQFNLDAGEIARFESDASIRNILSRVTGGQPSIIDGFILTTSFDVNLFLMNPSGILFGPNASLDVGGVNRGSFVATTLNAIAFPNGTQFSATNFSQDNRLLTVVGDPSGFIASQRPGPIASTGNVLLVAPGQTMMLLGGNINLDNTELLVRFPDGGRVELGSVAGAGQVGLTSQGNELRLNFPPTVPRGDIRIINTSRLDVEAEDRGSITINARNLTVSDSQVFVGIGASRGTPTSQAGNLTLNTTGTIRLDQNTEIRNNVNTDSQGNSGNIEVQAKSLLVLDGSFLSASTFARGNAGNVNIQADIVQLAGLAVDGTTSSISSTVGENSVGNAGNINIRARSLSVLNGANLSSSTFGQGNAGNIDVQASTVVFAGEGFNRDSSGAFSDVSTVTSVGNAGNIRIAAQSISILNGATLGSNTFGRGNAGNIDLQAERIEFAGFRSDGFSSSAFSSVARSTSVGNAGNIQIQAGRLTVLDGSTLSSSTFGRGDAGSISVIARDIIVDGAAPNRQPSGIVSDVSTGAIGNSKQISIQTDRLVLTGGGTLSTSTFGVGRSGNITVRAAESVVIDGRSAQGDGSGIYSTTNIGGVGDGGDITIDTGSLSIFNGAAINAGVFGTGNSGDVTIRARDRLLLDGGDDLGFASGIATAVDFAGTGNGGDLTLQARSITFSNGAIAEATSYGNGRAGNLFVTASEALVLQGTRPVNGQSGGLFSSTYGSGDGGNVVVTAPNIQVLNGAAMDVRTYGTGKGGNLFVNTHQLDLNTGGQLIAVTQGTGSAGNITVTARDRVTITGFDPTYSDRLAQFARYEENPNSINRITPFGGTLDSVAPNSGFFVRSQQTGEAGNMTVNTPTLRLSDRATLSAETASGNGGNINLNLPDLLVMRRNSTISATAGTAQAGGNGGNITIDTGFIVGVRSENSDIIANAFTGRGGNIRINAQGIFGLQFRPQLTPESDITASSTFGLSGLVSINTLNVDPNRGLVPLPVRLEDASRLITQTCTPRGTESVSSFVATGRGGVPTSPFEPLQSEAVMSDWVTAEERQAANGRRQEESLTPHSPLPTPVQLPTPPQLTEAQAWMKDDRGLVYLVATADTAQPKTAAIGPLVCPSSSFVKPPY